MVGNYTHTLGLSSEDLTAVMALAGNLSFRTLINPLAARSSEKSKSRSENERVYKASTFPILQIRDFVIT